MASDRCPINRICMLLAVRLGLKVKLSILHPGENDFEISRFDRRVTMLYFGPSSMLANSSSAIVFFDDSRFVTCDESVMDFFDCEVPFWELRRDTVEQLGGI